MNYFEKSKYQNAINEQFGSSEYEFLELIAYAVEGIDENQLKSADDDAVRSMAEKCADDALLYYEDQWTMIKHYQNPKECEYDSARDSFELDIRRLLENIKEDLSYEE